ncbi:MAG: EF-hand domain-containing protein [bacterium]
MIVALAWLAVAAPFAFADEPAKPYDAKAAFAEADTNHDGAIELDEFYNRLVDIFFLGDTDKDGFLTEEEFVRVVVVKEDFTQVDKSKDGKLSKREFVAARLPLFVAIDTDGDGELSLVEVTAAYEGRAKK